MSVSENGGTPKSSILIGISIINHPRWGTTILGNTHIALLFCHVLIFQVPQMFQKPKRSRKSAEANASKLALRIGDAFSLQPLDTCDFLGSTHR